MNLPLRIKLLQITGVLSLLTMFLEIAHCVIWTKLLFSCTLIVFLVIALYCTWRILVNNRVTRQEFIDYTMGYDKERWDNSNRSERARLVIRCFSVPCVIIGLALVPMLFIAMLLACLF